MEGKCDLNYKLRRRSKNYGSTYLWFINTLDVWFLLYCMLAYVGFLSIITIIILHVNKCVEKINNNNDF